MKANAYGHGLPRVAKAAEKFSDEFAVATFSEAMDLKSAGVLKPVNILGCAESSFYDLKSGYEGTLSGIVPSISDSSQLKFIDRHIEAVNIKVNTGMNRIGANPEDLNEIVTAALAKGLRIKSFFSHLYMGEDEACSAYQLDIFERAVAPFEYLKAKKHIAASSCLNLGQKFSLDMVRCGIASYGYSLYTKPVLSVYTNILQVLRVEAGAHIGYGDYTAPFDMSVAALRIGYADGYRRKKDYSEQRFVDIGGVLCPVVGQVCMDITLVDVSNVKLKGNDKVYILGGKVKGEDLAKSCGTIVYETLTSLGGRMKRNYIGQNCITDDNES